jgi:hypothetical protein
MTTRRVRLARPHQLAPVTMLKRDLNRRVAASSQPRNGPSAATNEDVLLRLALWLADVAADDPPVVESAS